MSHIPGRLSPARLVGTAASLLLTVSCGANSPTAHLSLGDVEFATPQTSGEPNLFPASDGRVLLSWFEPAGDGHALRVAVRSPEGWGEPRTVAAGRSFFVNWADFPSVVELTDGTWLAHWLERVGSPTYAYHVLVSTSDDRGMTWGPPRRLHADTSLTEHGFVSIAPAPGGGASLLWLDGQATGTAPDGHGGGGAMQLRANHLDPDGTLGREQLVDDRICDCCQTDLTRTTRGLVAAYRDRSDQEIRDIAVRRLIDGEWSEPVHVGGDRWEFHACPVNGPALSAAGDTVAVAWYTAPQGEPRVFVAYSLDGGASWEAPVRVDDGIPLGRVDLEMIDGRTAIVSWLERRGEEDAVVRARPVSLAGVAGDAITVAETSQARASGFPRMIRTGDEMVFAWNLLGEDGGVRVRAARLR